MEEEKIFIVDEACRLDLFLSQKLTQTRSQVAQLVKKGFVTLDEKVTTKVGQKLKLNQKVKVIFPKVEEKTYQEVSFDVPVLYEDDALLVINKPSGLVVHDAPSVKEATLVDWLKSKGVQLSTISGEERHGIVHRLDKGTSGVMVVAKTNEAHQFLSNQLQDKSMGRYYIAVIAPPLKEVCTIVEKPIGRNPSNRLKMGCVAGGKEAKSAFLSLQHSKDEKEQLIGCKLFTGRTHQIRVHLESMSRHIVGDSVYGSKKKALKDGERILLHALMIYFIHPVTKEMIQVSAPLDTVFSEYLKKKFDMENINVEELSQDISQQFRTCLS